MKLKLNATKREGKGQLQSLRTAGRVPAVVYGHAAAATPLALDSHEFSRVFARAGRTHLVDLVVEGGRAQKVLVREVQTHPRRQGPMHVDFYRVSLKEKLHAEVPVVTVGESPAVKLNLGDLLLVKQALEVECLPADIPEAVEVDISHLNAVDDSVRVTDLNLPPGVTVLSDPEDTLVKIAAKRVAEAEIEAPAGAVEASGEETS